MKYAVSEKKIAHIIREDAEKGWCGYLSTACENT